MTSPAIRVDKSSLYRAVTFVAAAVVVVICTALCYLVWGALASGEETQGESAAQAVFGNAQVVRSMVNTLIVAAIIATVAVTLGSVFAWLFKRTDLRGSGYFDLMLTGQFALPPVLCAIAWIALYAPGVGYVNYYVGEKLIGADVLNIYTMTGIVVVMTATFTSFAYLLVAGAFTGGGFETEEAARVHGAGNFATLRMVSLPRVWPAVAAAWAVLFVVVAQTFPIPLFLGNPAGIDMLAPLMYSGLNTGRFSLAEVSLMAVLLLLPTAVSVGMLFTVNRNARRAGTIASTGGGSRLRLGRSRRGWLILNHGYVLATLIAPVAAIFLVSFLKFQTPRVRPELFTLDNYRSLAQDPTFLRALLNTVGSSLGVATVGTALALFVAYGVHRFPSPMTRLADVLVLVPVGIRFVLSIGFLWAFTLIPVLNASFGSLLLIGVALIVSFIGIAVRTVTAGLLQTSVDFDDAAAVHGAGPWTRLLRVTVPMQATVLIGTWRIYFILSTLVADVVVLLYVPDSLTLSVMTFVRLDQAFGPAVFPLAVVQLVMVFIVVGLSQLAISFLESRRRPTDEGQ